MRQRPFSELAEDVEFQKPTANFQWFWDINKTLQNVRNTLHPLKFYWFIKVFSFFNQNETKLLLHRHLLQNIHNKQVKIDEEIIYKCLQTVISRKKVVENKCSMREIVTIAAQWMCQFWPFKDALRIRRQTCNFYI